MVEYYQNQRGESFVVNDACLHEEERMWLITGPNMGGKSTFLRQCAIISIMAQMGSFVPAEQARLGIVDKILCRIGASDDLSSNQSTFMVEMQEAAHILNTATPRSLVIMDEVGRGTSNHDGIAIAFAILQHLLQVNRSLVVFATHYHELIPLIQQRNIQHIGYYRAMIHTNPDGTMSCLYKISPGVIDQSHGIRIAQQAGLPDPVISEAYQIYQLVSSSD